MTMNTEYRVNDNSSTHGEDFQTEQIGGGHRARWIERNRWGRAVALAVALAVSASAAHAQAPGGNPQYWIGGGGGSATLGDDSCNPELPFVREDTVCDDKDAGYKFYAGRALTDYLAAEVFVARLGEASFTTTRYFRGGGLREVTLTGRHNVSVGATAMVVVPMKRLDALLKVGPQWWSRGLAYGDEEIDVNTSGFDLTWGLGARYRIGNRASVRVEVERFVIDIHDLNFVSGSLAWHF